MARLINDPIMSQVKENLDRLDKCEYHDFSIDMTPNWKIGKRWRCRFCGGEVENIQKHYYDKGREHQERKMLIDGYRMEE